MAKKSLIARENRRIKTVNKYANKIADLKNTIKHGTDEEAFEARQKLSALPRNAHKVRRTFRCKVTGRPKGVIRKFGLCRNQLRKFFENGLIPGMTKSSW